MTCFAIVACLLLANGIRTVLDMTWHVKNKQKDGRSGDRATVRGGVLTRYAKLCRTWWLRWMIKSHHSYRLKDRSRSSERAPLPRPLIARTALLLHGTRVINIRLVKIRCIVNDDLHSKS